MTNSEDRNKFNDVFKIGQEENHTKQEEQVVIAGDHVAGTQPDKEKCTPSFRQVA